MNIRNFAAATAAVSLAVAPAIAADRTDAPVEGASEVGGSAVFLGLLAAAAIIGGIIIASDGGSDNPISA
jgi:hypothetical protein